MTKDAKDRLHYLRWQPYLTQEELDELRQLGMQEYEETRLLTNKTKNDEH